MKNTQGLTEKILFEDYEQPFEWLTKEYGRAEFILCPIIKEDKIIEVHMYPIQQPDAKNYFVIKNDEGWKGIHFGCLLIEGKPTFSTVILRKPKDRIEQPVVWKTHFCKDHKTHSFRLYVPRESKSFFITSGLGDFCLNWK